MQLKVRTCTKSGFLRSSGFNLEIVTKSGVTVRSGFNLEMRKVFGIIVFIVIWDWFGKRIWGDLTEIGLL
jgi:hypothetical protein